MMSNFEKYILYIGYTRHYWNGKSWEPFPENNEPYYSSLGNVAFLYMNGSKQIYFGLNEKGMPPTLIYPRPKGVETDHEMNRILEQNTPQQVLNLIFK